MCYSELYDRVFSYELSDNERMLPVLNLDNNKIEGNEIVGKSDLFSLRVEACILDILDEEGFSVFRPVYKGERPTFLALSSDSRIIIHLSLDSEDERVVFRASELSSQGYTVIIIRLVKQNESGSVIEETLDEFLFSEI